MGTQVPPKPLVSEAALADFRILQNASKDVPGKTTIFVDATPPSVFATFTFHPS